MFVQSRKSRALCEQSILAPTFVVVVVVVRGELDQLLQCWHTAAKETGTVEAPHIGIGQTLIVRRQVEIHGRSLQPQEEPRFFVFVADPRRRGEGRDWMGGV